jgi:hypothetical protein
MNCTSQLCTLSNQRRGPKMLTDFMNSTVTKVTLDLVFLPSLKGSPKLWIVLCFHQILGRLHGEARCFWHWEVKLSSSHSPGNVAPSLTWQWTYTVPRMSGTVLKAGVGTWSTNMQSVVRVRDSYPGVEFGFMSHSYSALWFSCWINLSRGVTFR